MYSKDIAIVGMSVKLPYAETPWELHQLLLSLGDGITKFDVDKEGWIGAKGLIERYNVFDASHFGISESEANILDPQHRLLLEKSWEALEIAGLKNEKQPLDCGVFTSCSANHNYWELCNRTGGSNPIKDYNVLISNDKDFLATRIAYHLDLTGPAMTIQCGCSSSLVAVHQASNALRNEECEIALVGAASLPTPLKSGYFPSEGMIFSPNGECNPYTDFSDGIVAGTGVVVIVLMPLEKALYEKRDVWAVIKGSAINNDGHHKISFSAPGYHQQVDVIQKAFRNAKIQTKDVGYIEGHGTGTALGDAVELSALADVFGKINNLPHLGSIKANIGHLDVASGLAGLIKCILSVKYKVIYPQPRVTGNNVSIDCVFPIASTPVLWEGEPRIACVSSLGVGGTNAHIIIENYPSCCNLVKQSNELPFILAAKSENSLLKLCRQLKDAITAGNSEDLPRVAYTLYKRYHQFEFPFRIIINSSNHINLISALENCINNGYSNYMQHDFCDLIFDLEEISGYINLPATPLEGKKYGLEEELEEKQVDRTSILENPASLSPELVSDVWKRILGTNVNSSRDSHFFEEGGNSLLAIQFIQELRQTGIKNLSIDMLYSNPRLGDFTNKLMEEVEESEEDICSEIYKEI